MTSEVFTIATDNLLTYLAGRGLLPKGCPPSIRELGGGVSNIVLLIEWPGQRWVAKQALSKLRVKDDWPADRDRIFREAEAIQALRLKLADAALPELVHVDRDNFMFIMTAAPSDSEVWKEALLAGRVDLAVAERAGALLGRLIHASRNDPELRERCRERFRDRTAFDQLRIDPYYRTAAARHPDVRKDLEELMADSWRIQASLVHGDYSPKNMLVQKDGRIFLIDFEVIHWGDPAFDAGFLLNHLFLKALHQPRFAPLYFEAIRECWQALAREMKENREEKFEVLSLRHLGGLMLARIDGKSPVEYIRDEETKERVRRVAKRVIRERPERIREAVRLCA